MGSKYNQLQIQMSINSSVSFSEEFVIENPEDLTTKQIQCNQQQIRCRICYQSSKPLVSICACTGSIQYVHEQCILDWIAKKLQLSDVLDIPRCQICHQKFSARMKIGKKKLCLALLWEKIKAMKQNQIVLALLHLLMFLFCVFTMIIGLNAIFQGKAINYSPVQNSNSPNNNNVQIKQWRISDILSFTITHIMCPIYGIIYFLSCLKSKQRWMQQLMVQVVEVVLQPRIVKKY